jgi:hypothetical protein
MSHARTAVAGERDGHGHVFVRPERALVMSADGRRPALPDGIMQLPSSNAIDPIADVRGRRYPGVLAIPFLTVTTTRCGGQGDQRRSGHKMLCLL